MFAGKQLAGLVGIFLALSVTACTTIDINDHCRYSQSDAIRSASPDSLGLLLGTSPDWAKIDPYVVLYSPSQESPELTVKLNATPNPHAMPLSLDESMCARVDWSSYSLSVDAEEWSTFWAQEHPAKFEIWIAFLEEREHVRLSSFGAAIIDTSSNEPLFSCGCYWE